MRDDFQRGSDQDLNRILEEYSAINQNRAQRSQQNQNANRNMPQNGKQVANINRPVQNRYNQNIRSDSAPNGNAARYSQQGNPAQIKKEHPKKFVLNIDESVLDAPANEPSRRPQGNSNGIYFSNYQRNRNRVGNVPVGSANKPVIQPNKPVVQQQVDKVNSQDVTSSKSKTAERSKKRFGGAKKALVFISAIILSTVLLSFIGVSCVCDMLAINREDKEITVTIPEGADYKQVIDILYDNDLIDNKLFCIIFSKYRGFDELQYKKGSHTFKINSGIEGMLRTVSISPNTSKTVQISFPEGFTIQEIVDRLVEKGVCNDPKELYAAIKSSYSYDFYKEIEDDSQRYFKLEGYMFPDTYEFYVGADADYVAKKFLDNFQSKWTPEYQARAEKLGYTCDEIMIIASIIQAEAKDINQMKTVSSVIHNRLNRPSVYPSIGCLATRHYAENSLVLAIAGESGINVENEEEMYFAKSEAMYYIDAYDTDRDMSNKGLPPGPICNPGMDAIRAALYPDSTQFYYFLHDSNGEIYTATNSDDFAKLKAEILEIN